MSVGLFAVTTANIPRCCHRRVKIIVRAVNSRRVRGDRPEKILLGKEKRDNYVNAQARGRGRARSQTRKTLLALKATLKCDSSIQRLYLGLLTNYNVFYCLL